MSKVDGHPSLIKIVKTTLDIWPEHCSYCDTRFENDTPEFLDRMEQVAKLVIANTGDDLPRYCKDYRWMCEEFLKEELYFARHNEYRLSTFEEANREVYSNAEYMPRYVRGILISQILWDPHARAFDYFRSQFLDQHENGTNYLEVGPGHGLFLYFASQSKKIASLEAWDVSESSIAETRSALNRLGVDREISIVLQDVLQAPSRREEFDAAVISEVLEHLERPDLALQSLHAALRPGGRIFINAPINSPAPDHIYLWRTTDEFVDFVGAQGFEIESAQFFPVTGVNLDRAKRKNMSISCVVIGKKIAGETV
ncbi:MAG: class I SAM-dependent methyltransferase [Sphingorhabdus sp.]